MKRLVDRLIESKYQKLYFSAFAILAAFLAGAIVILLNKQNPLLAYGALLQGAFGKPYKIANTLQRAVPLTLTGLSVAVAFKAGVWNIGSEGQLYLGAFAAAWAGFTFSGLPWFLFIPLLLLFGIVGGGIGGAIPGVLKARYGMDEVITTIMLNNVFILLTSYLVNYPFKTLQGQMGATDKIAEAARLSRLVRLSKLNTGLFLTLIIVLCMLYLMQKSSVGYEWKMIGENSRFAKYIGMNPSRHIVVVMIVSGALAGIAGALEVLGVHYRFIESISPGYGYDGILIAMIAIYHPLGVVLVALIFGALKVGALPMEQFSNVPSELIDVLQSIIILFVAAETGLIAWIRSKGGNHAAH
ncbi:ABC transporter permease [candidate division KSB3 bacterium]|uniref:ABC transporter permease n=1 Tax=candidate division KSB3 bacterium TaxID=2044937 RepID=A0A2G6KDI7_9BACT|nr:MAG: ABC transporter permease [candidate division KSB3 bacterium]